MINSVSAPLNFQVFSFYDLALALQHISRVELDGSGKYVKHEKLLQDFARFRALAQSPDGYIYAATESPGKLIKLIPLK